MGWLGSSYLIAKRHKTVHYMLLNDGQNNKTIQKWTWVNIEDIIRSNIHDGARTGHEKTEKNTEKKE